MSERRRKLLGGLGLRFEVRRGAFIEVLARGDGQRFVGVGTDEDDAFDALYEAVFPLGPARMLADWAADAGAEPAVLVPAGPAAPEGTGGGAQAPYAGPTVTYVSGQPYEYARRPAPFEPAQWRGAPVYDTHPRVYDEVAGSALIEESERAIDVIAVSHRELQRAHLRKLYARARSIDPGDDPRLREVYRRVTDASAFLRPGMIRGLVAGSRPFDVVPGARDWADAAERANLAYEDAVRRFARTHGRDESGYGDRASAVVVTDREAVAELVQATKVLGALYVDGLNVKPDPRRRPQVPVAESDLLLTIAARLRALRVVVSAMRDWPPGSSEAAVYPFAATPQRLWGLLIGRLRFLIEGESGDSPEERRFTSVMADMLDEDSLGWTRPIPPLKPREEHAAGDGEAADAEDEDEGAESAEPIDPGLVEKALAFIGGRELVILGNKVNERLRTRLSQVLNLEVEWVPVADNPRRLEGVLAGAVDRRCYVMTRHLPHKVTDRVWAVDRRAPIVYGVGLQQILTTLADRATQQFE